MKGGSNSCTGKVIGAMHVGICEDESSRQREKEPTSQRKGSKVFPERSCHWCLTFSCDNKELQQGTISHEFSTTQILRKDVGNHKAQRMYAKHRF